jgi:uncharacterized protein
MRQYGGSVAVDAGGRLIAVSAPRGNLVTFWDAAEAAYLTSTMLADGCGVAPTDQPGEFLITSGLGQAMCFAPQTGKRTALDLAGLADSGWDNHLRMAVPPA